MNLSYMLRLLCLSLCSLFLVHTALALAVSLAASRAIRLAGRMKPRRASGFLFGLRLLPAALASLAVFGYCVPSFVWLEPHGGIEQVGLQCIGLALLGAAICILPMAGVVKAAAGSVRFSRTCEWSGRKTYIRDEMLPVWVVAQQAPLLAVSGILRPKLVASSNVLGALSADELRAALLHERAHRIWRDNFKRMLFLLTPWSFPFARGLEEIERGWARFTEWAADDLAVDGDPQRALSLASALIHVARLGSAAPQAVYMSSLAGGHDLRERVERLLRVERMQGERPRMASAIFAGAALLITSTIAATLLWPASLFAVHHLLERLIG